MKEFIKTLLNILSNINEKYRINNEQVRKAQRNAIDYDFAYAVAYEMGECLRGERFPLCAEIRGANSFIIEKIVVSDDHTTTKILFGIQRDSPVKCGISEVYNKIQVLMNQCLFNQARYVLGPSCGSEFSNMFPMLAHGINVLGVHETVSEVQISVLVYWAPEYRIY